MRATVDPGQGRSAVARGWFVLGAALAAAFLLALAEGFLDLFPPSDLHPYLGEASPLTGLCVPDEEFGATYRSWEALAADNATALRRYLPFRERFASRKPWAMFGNSFVQAPGMLADTTRQVLPEQPVFNLGRNEPFALRLAQAEMLLDHGLEPERVFIELMPVDLVPLGEQPLATLHVSACGALTYEPRRPPEPAGWLVDHSRLAFTAWCRSGLQRGNPRFSKRTIHRRVEEPLRGDVRRLFAGLARATGRHAVPVTVLLIPTYQQVCQGEGFGFQNDLTPLLRELGQDVFDPRAAFLRHPDRPALFLPDRHLTPLGNRLLLDELLAHLRALDTGPRPAGSPAVRQNAGEANRS